MAMATAAIPTPSIPIARLHPELNAETVSVTGIVTLIWPYASSTHSTSLLLVEPDFRLRRHQGQVRVHFHGSSAKAVARARISIGDKILLSLRGTTWGRNPQLSTTPGKSIEWELQYGERLLLQVQHEAQEPIFLDVDHPPPSPESTAQSSITRRSSSYNSHVATFTCKSLFDGNAWESPAFLKRNHFAALGYDIFTEEADEIPDNDRRKRLNFGRSSNEWRFADRTPSPQKVFETDEWNVASPSRSLASTGSYSTTTSSKVQSPERTEAGVVVGDEKPPMDESMVEDNKQVSNVAPPSPPPTSVDSPKHEEPNQVLQQTPTDSDLPHPMSSITPSPNNIQEFVSQSEGTSKREFSDDLVSTCPVLGSKMDGSISSHPDESSKERLPDNIIADNPEPIRIAAENEHSTLATKIPPPDNDNDVRMQEIDGESFTVKESAHDLQLLDDRSTAHSDSPGHDEQTAKQLGSDPIPACDQLEGEERDDASAIEKSEVLASAEVEYPAGHVGKELQIKTNAGEAPSDHQPYDKSFSEAEEICQDPISQVPIHVRTVQETQGGNHIVLGAEPPDEQADLSTIEGTFEAQAIQGLRPVAVKEIKVEIIDLESEAESAEQLEILENEDESSGRSENFGSGAESEERNEHVESQDESVKRLGGLQNEAESTEQPDHLGNEHGSVERLEYLESEDESVEQLKSPQKEDESMEQSEHLESDDGSAEHLDQPSPNISSELPFILSAAGTNTDTTEKLNDRSATLRTATTSTLGEGKPTASLISSHYFAEEARKISLRAGIVAESSSLQNESPNVRSSRGVPLRFEGVDYTSRPPNIETMPKLQVEIESDKRAQQEEPSYFESGEEVSATEQRECGPESPVIELAPHPQIEIEIKQMSLNSLIELPSTVPDSIQEPLMKSQLLTPDETQRTSFESQPPATPLRAAPDDDTLATPRLTQGHSAEIIIPTAPSPERRPSLVSEVSYIQKEDSEGEKKTLGEDSSRLQKAPTLIEKLKAMRRLSGQTPQKLGNASAVSPWFMPKQSSIVVPDSEVESGEESLSEDDGKVSNLKNIRPFNTPDKQKPLAKSFIRSPPPRESASSVASSPGYLPPSQPPPPGFRTNLSYYVPLSTLQSHFSLPVDVLTIALTATDVTRAPTGPRDFHQTIYVTDPMSSFTKTPITATQIFRAKQGCFPIIERGDAILLREFKVQSFQRQMVLLSTQLSAWAVFRQGTDVQVRGPPVEFGAEERGFASGLWRWWDDLSEETKERLYKAVPKGKDKGIKPGSMSNTAVKQEGQQNDRTIKNEVIEGLGVDLPDSQGKMRKSSLKESTFDPDDPLETTGPAKRVLRLRGSRTLPEKSGSPKKMIERSSGIMFTGGLGEPGSP